MQVDTEQNVNRSGDYASNFEKKKNGSLEIFINRAEERI